MNVEKVISLLLILIFIFKVILIACLISINVKKFIYNLNETQMNSKNIFISLILTSFHDFIGIVDFYQIFV